MLKLPKGLKKKKKGKKSKHKEKELFTEEELEKYKKEHQLQNSESGENQTKENEEWSKFKDLTTGIDSVLKKTQGDLDRIKSTSYFQRVPAGVKEVDGGGKEIQQKPAECFNIPQYSEADFITKTEVCDDTEKSDYAVTDTESEEEDDIFDTSYVEAVERGEVKLAYVPDSPEDFKDDGLFDTSHVDAIIKGQDIKTSKGKKALDIGVAVEVLTGRIDNVTITTKRSKRVVPGDLLLESSNNESAIINVAHTSTEENTEQSILDTDADIPITSPIDLSISLHTSLIQQQKESIKEEYLQNTNQIDVIEATQEEDEFDEFALLAAESLEINSKIIKIEKEELEIKPVLEESWSAFEANKNSSVFAESIIEDQIDVDPYIGESDPFDTSFAEAVVPNLEINKYSQEVDIIEEDDDFDPRADEVKVKLNNRRKSSVRIHLTDPTGLRESITSDDIFEKEVRTTHDLLGGSTTDLTQLGDSPLQPVDINETHDIDPFDTTIVDKIVVPGKVELKLLEEELITSNPVYRVDSDPDFDPRADEVSKNDERRASRPENLIVNKSVLFNIEGTNNLDLDTKTKPTKPLTPYYTRELSITEDIEEAEVSDNVSDTLQRTRSDEDLTEKSYHQTKRRHSEYPSHTKFNFKTNDFFGKDQSELSVKVLTPSGPEVLIEESEIDPFDTSFATNIVPSKTELRLLAKEFSCEDTINVDPEDPRDLIDPSEDFFQAKALTPEPTSTSKIPERELDPFDTSFASNLGPGKTELKILEFELLN